MPGSQPPRTRSLTSKPPLASSTAARSTSLSGTPAPEPLDTPQSPIDSTLPAKTPLNACAAKDFLCKASFLESKTETCMAMLCSNLLVAITTCQDISQTVCTLIHCVTLIMPEAFALVCQTNSQLTTILDKIDTLLSNSDKEPTASSPPVLAELGEKLDRVTQDIQKAAETWQTVPPAPGLRPPPPTSTPHALTTPLGLTHVEIAKNRCIQSQGCFILIEPNLESMKSSFDSLSTHTLTTKAELAWEAAWPTIEGTGIAKALNLSGKPQITFKAAL
ncbi:hypothetical protein OPQ81_009039 [Rhizoctonia solani]|nr:hypothetical protein OPQ81_009039 [Rhizoctonia solani]